MDQFPRRVSRPESRGAKNFGKFLQLGSADSFFPDDERSVCRVRQMVGSVKRNFLTKNKSEAGATESKQKQKKVSKP
jgi:hypothetical protein